MTTTPDWKSRGKTIRGLILELQSFQDQDMEVRMSLDDGNTSIPISLVAKHADCALLLNAEQVPSVLEH